MYSRCNARKYVRKGKGRPDITEVMFYSGYPSGSNSSLNICNSLIRFLLAGGGGKGGTRGVGRVMEYT